MLVRTRGAASGPLLQVEADGGAVAALVNLCLLDTGLSGDAPLSAYREGKRVMVWSSRRATEAVRQIASRAGRDAMKVSLHSMRIGSATTLAAGGMDEL